MGFRGLKLEPFVVVSVHDPAIAKTQDARACVYRYERSRDLADLEALEIEDKEAPDGKRRLQPYLDGLRPARFTVCPLTQSQRMIAETYASPMREREALRYSLKNVTEIVRPDGAAWTYEGEETGFGDDVKKLTQERMAELENLTSADVIDELGAVVLQEAHLRHSPLSQRRFFPRRG